MGLLDVLAKEYLRKNEIFADLVNMAIFRGKQRVRPENLRELDTTSEAIVVSGTEKDKPIQMIRDIFKECVAFTDGEHTYVYIGIENQTKIDYAMPLRVAVSNDLFWLRQIREKQRVLREEGRIEDRITSVPKETKLHPVMTIVLYWGDKPWDGPRSMRDMIAPLLPEFEALIPDYPIVIIEPRALSPKQMNRLHSDLKAVFECMRKSKDRNALRELISQDKRFKDLDSLAALLINTVLKLKLRICDEKKEEKIDMCQAWEEILAEERNNGIKSVEPTLTLLKTKNELLEEENTSIKAENTSIKAKAVSLEAENEHAKQMLRELGWSEESIRALFCKKAP